MRARTIQPAKPMAVLGFVILLAIAPTASACPFCDGGPSGVNQVREAIFDSNFYSRVAATLAPFPIFSGIVALIYFAPLGLVKRDIAKVTDSTHATWLLRDY